MRLRMSSSLIGAGSRAELTDFMKKESTQGGAIVRDRKITPE